MQPCNARSSSPQPDIIPKITPHDSDSFHPWPIPITVQSFSYQHTPQQATLRQSLPKNRFALPQHSQVLNVRKRNEPQRVPINLSKLPVVALNTSSSLLAAIQRSNIPQALDGPRPVQVVILARFVEALDDRGWKLRSPIQEPGQQSATPDGTPVLMAKIATALAIGGVETLER